MTDDLERLVRQVRPGSAIGLRPDAGAWAAAERSLGCRLPSDYGMLVERYGSGWFGGFLTVFDPSAVPASMRLVEAGMDQIALMRENRELDPDEPMPYSIFPEPGGLLPWGTTINGDTGYWVTEPRDDPDRWTVVVGEVRGPGWYPHEGSLSSLLALLTNPSTFRSFGASELMPDRWAASSPTFERN